MKQVILDFPKQFNEEQYNKGLDKALSFAIMKGLTPPAPSLDRAGFVL